MINTNINLGDMELKKTNYKNLLDRLSCSRMYIIRHPNLTEYEQNEIKSNICDETDVKVLFSFIENMMHRFGEYEYLLKFAELRINDLLNKNIKTK